jgi:Domain of unknown function (DUF1992)
MTERKATERKPPGTSFTSWIDQRIDEAAQRGAFDNLPGAGKPIPRRREGENGTQAWLREYLRREGVSGEELLPTPLRLRKEIERLTETGPGLRSEQEVREVVAELNQRITEWRRVPLGPPVFLPLVDEDLMVSRWRDAHPVTPPAPAQTHVTDRPRWWHRIGRRRFTTVRSGKSVFFIPNGQWYHRPLTASAPRGHFAFSKWEHGSCDRTGRT